MLESNRQNDYLRHLMGMQYELYAYVVALTGRGTDAEDVLQNTNLRVMELVSDETLPVIDNFRAWIKKVAFFQVLTWRKRVRRGHVVFDSGLIEAFAEQLEERQSASDERLDALETCLKKLPLTLRQMTEERYSDGGGVKRLAGKWRTTPHAITMNLYRVRLMLKACIEKTLVYGERL